MAGNGTEHSGRDEDRPANGSPGRQIVVVPRMPGPLRVLDDAGAARGDELDAMIDEVFGPSTDEGPGLFDFVLVLGGVALVAWSWVSGGAGPWFIIGITAIVLGIALPARSIVRATRDQRIVRRQRRVLRTGHALDASDATVGALVGSYDSLQHAATLPGSPAGSAAVEAGHAALLEVASLLDWRPPLSNEEREYVERRTRAIRDLTAQIIRGSRAWQRARMRDDADVTEGARERAAAVARAREELETGTGATPRRPRTSPRLPRRSSPARSSSSARTTGSRGLCSMPPPRRTARNRPCGPARWRCRRSSRSGRRS